MNFKINVLILFWEIFHTKQGKNRKRRMFMASVKLMLNKQRVLKNGKYPLVFQIIHNRRKRLIYTGIKLFPEEFDSVSFEIKASRFGSFSQVERKEMNQELKRNHIRIVSKIRKLEKSNESFSVDDLLDLKKRKTRCFYLLRYAELQIAHKRKIGKDGTALAYQSTKVSLEKYIKTLSKKGVDVKIVDIDYRFILAYEDFLYMQGVSENTVNYYLRNFRTIYNAAMREGGGRRGDHPFSHIRTKACKTVKRALDKDEMKSLWLLPLSDFPELEFYRDLYLFSFYTQGMAFVDIVFLKKNNINGGLLTYSRHKSKQLIHIALTPKIQSLIDKYSNDSEYVFPIIDIFDSELSAYKQYRLALGRMNRHLKKIASKLNLSIPLTTYTARHTWATLARDVGAPLSVISAGLGHTSEEMTRVYLKDFDQSVLAKVNSLVTSL